MPIPDGARYTSPARRTVELADGSRVSRQNAENLFAQSHGFRSEYDRKKAYGSPGMRAFMSRPGYQSAASEARAAGVSRKDFNAAAARYYANENVNRADNSPDGPKAKMLEAMGRRSPGTDYAVGESPSIF
jgi:hypothetical protein